ncbi:GNAT family N-acetyltransferase [Gilvimarinus sp. DA14]|uniref:GNAT family N-acetyltransferase n=1 Tax=Gilvimarinus sp. DA14 TaxID=2956798 RepID=UPI0020B82E17|nr:GNAT family N-acetyltransferase [Gilvimarinus sp. DA14]UTF58601.1 GNAT family N-acetyltransferase [Gilvimarinus sp. DA14]
MQPITVDAQVSLQPVMVADAAEIFALVDSNRLHLRQWLPWVDATTTLTDMQKFLADASQDNKQGRDATFCVVHAASKVGICSLNAINKSPGQARIGYWLAEDYCGQGIMSRSVNSLCQFGFAVLKLHTLILCAAEHNEKSRAIAERLGFSNTRKIMAAEDLYGEEVNHIRYALTLSQFEKNDYDPSNYSA